MKPSTLFIISTPIGNPDDITYRAIEVLKNVDVVLSEDTRETDKLLQRYQIKASQISYRDQNHTRVFNQIYDLLVSGKTLALVTDNGTPLISDPGFKLVRELLARDINIESVPGPSAIVASLSISGLPTDNFSFLGFLPKSSNQRKDLIKKHGNLDTTLVIYESPYRIKKLIEEVIQTLGNRKGCLVKDLTKKYEVVIRGTLTDIYEKLSKDALKGEIVLLVAKENY